MTVKKIVKMLEKEKHDGDVAMSVELLSALCADFRMRKITRKTLVIVLKCLVKRMEKL